MKVVKYLGIALYFIASGMKSIRIQKELPITPKAGDLSDHFGTEPVQNIYGPHHNGHVRLMREGVTGEGTPVKPILNYHKEIIDSQVVAGDLDNTSYDAGLIIRPEYAGK